MNKQETNLETTPYKLMVQRLQPTTIKGIKISGYLKTFPSKTSEPDLLTLIEIKKEIGENYGGGQYQLRTVDTAGKYIGSECFEISGLPKMPKLPTPTANEASLKKELLQIRSATIQAIQQIHSIEQTKQHSTLTRLNRIVKELDSLTEILAPPPPKQQYLFDGLLGTSKDLLKDGNHSSNPTDWKLMVFRLEPQMAISGYIKTFQLPITIPDIIENIGQTCGGGKYQLRILDESKVIDDERYVKSKIFEIAGLPLMPIPGIPFPETPTPGYNEPNSND